MKMKKGLAALLALTLAAVGLTACGEPSNTQDDDRATTTTIAATTTTAPTTTTVPATTTTTTPAAPTVELSKIGFQNWQGYDTWVMIDSYDFDGGYVYTLNDITEASKFQGERLFGVRVAPNGTVIEDPDLNDGFTLIIRDNNNAVMSANGYETALKFDRFLDADERWIIWKMNDANLFVPLSMIDFSKPTEDVILPGYANEYHGTKYYLK